MCLFCSVLFFVYSLQLKSAKELAEINGHDESQANVGTGILCMALEIYIYACIWSQLYYLCFKSDRMAE